MSPPNQNPQQGSPTEAHATRTDTLDSMQSLVERHNTFSSTGARAKNALRGQRRRRTLRKKSGRVDSSNSALGGKNEPDRGRIKRGVKLTVDRVAVLNAAFAHRPTSEWTTSDLLLPEYDDLSSYSVSQEIRRLAQIVENQDAPLRFANQTPLKEGSPKRIWIFRFSARGSLSQVACAAWITRFLPSPTLQYLLAKRRPRIS